MLSILWVEISEDDSSANVLVPSNAQYEETWYKTVMAELTTLSWVFKLTSWCRLMTRCEDPLFCAYCMDETPGEYSRMAFPKLIVNFCTFPFSVTWLMTNSTANEYLKCHDSSQSITSGARLCCRYQTPPVAASMYRRLMLLLRPNLINTVPKNECMLCVSFVNRLKTEYASWVNGRNW